MLCMSPIHSRARVVGVVAGPCSPGTAEQKGCGEAVKQRDWHTELLIDQFIFS